VYTKLSSLIGHNNGMPHFMIYRSAHPAMKRQKRVFWRHPCTCVFVCPRN